ncbi:creatininase family protein [Paenibacillus sp. Marseille-Q4541]|uniref:creatininase family protein n=1 Tax=Paenibacillus sp. Marseille-Q4541 TaxID=2831522 RepID=UPI001BA8B579|nr:creatininase family protein [Paenibacillus sp. Marseille-Q4541]
MVHSIFAGTMADMTWTDVQKSIENEAIVLLPSGVIEQQGPHLVTGMDVYSSHLICNKIKAELDNSGIESLIAPPFYWGINHVTSAFPGSFTSRRETVKNVLYDIFDCLHRWGVKHVFLVDIHGDPVNGLALHDAISEARSKLRLDVRSVISHWIAEDLEINKQNDHFLIFDVPLPDPPHPEQSFPEFLDIHAGESGTAGMVKYFPGLVNTNIAQTLAPTNLTRDDLKKWHIGGETAKKITPLGYFGAPAEYSKVKYDEIDFYEGFSRFASIAIKKYLNYSPKT